jgi:hypothetical protein
MQGWVGIKLGHRIAAIAAAVTGLGGLATTLVVRHASAAPSVPTPTITAGPAHTTTSTSATFTYNDARVKTKHSFTISGNASALFYPGLTQALNLSITNPYGKTITVSQITITVNDKTSRNGSPNPSCSGTANLKVLRQFNGSATIAGHTTTTLSGAGVPSSKWPQLQMPNSPTNQDACQTTTFSLTYTGTAS